jgi:hypothetical protein
MECKMNKFTTIALTAILSFSGASAALADSSLDALGSADSVSITSVNTNSDNILLSSGGRVMQQVDLASLRAVAGQNMSVAAQLEAYGVGIDDVIGITGSNSNDVTLYVRG